MGKGFGYRKTKKGKPNHNDYREFLLLPKLLSGELRVKEAEKLIEDVV